jgi:hypothetical protein
MFGISLELKGNFERKEKDMLFKRLIGKFHKHRYLIGITIALGIGFILWHCFWTVYPANIESKLSLRLQVDKMSYVQAEPVRLTAAVVNTTDEPITIS